MLICLLVFPSVFLQDPQEKEGCGDRGESDDPCLSFREQGLVAAWRLLLMLLAPLLTSFQMGILLQSPHVLGDSAEA